MTPTPRRAALFTCLVALLVGLAIAVAARQASPARSPEQILKRMQALSEEAKTCSDLARLQQIAQEIQQLGFEYKQAIEGKGGAGVTLPEARKADTAATGQLEGREDDPCYPVLHAGAVTQRLYGTKPKTRCIPAEVRLTWEMEERGIRTDRWPTAVLDYRLQESYPGYLQMVYDPVTPSKLAAYYLVGPSPQRDDRITARITRGKATGLVAEAYGVPTLYKTIDLSGPDRFVVTPDSLRQGISFAYDKDSSASPSLEGAVTGAQLDLNAAGVVREPYRLATHVNLPGWGGLAARGRITLEELQEALKSKRLVKQLRADTASDHTAMGLPYVYKQTGSVTMEVLFEPAVRMTVTPEDGFASQGPDDRGEFTPASRTYEVRNAGDIPIQFTVTKAAPWLRLSPASGEVAAGGNATVTVSVDPAMAKAIKPGFHTDTVAFTNATNGSGNTSRPATLNLSEEQTWQATVRGWELDQMKWDGLVLNDTKTGTTAKITHGVRFNWDIGARFVIRKQKGRWVYKEGVVTSANIEPALAFTPPGLYACGVSRTKPKMDPSGLVGRFVAGSVVDDRVSLNWHPYTPSVLVECRPLHPDLKRPFSRTFESSLFYDRMRSKSYPLANKTFPPDGLPGVLSYSMTLKRLR